MKLRIKKKKKTHLFVMHPATFRIQLYYITYRKFVHRVKLVMHFYHAPQKKNSVFESERKKKGIPARTVLKKNTNGFLALPGMLN